MTGLARATPALASGGAAEDRAADFLARHGLRIVARNYRTRMGEIDLIALDGDTYVFVEVRMRNAAARFGGAPETITRAKRRRIIAAALQFIGTLRWEPPCRFDVVCVEDGEATWMKGAFDAD